VIIDLLRHAAPVNGNAALIANDKSGIIVAGLLIDAGEARSPVLVQIGPAQIVFRQPRESR